MKKIALLILTVLLPFSNRLLAQAGAISVNNCTDFTVSVTVYGYAPTTCDAYGCGTTYVTNTISVPSIWGTPGTCSGWGPFSPCGIGTGVGWATNACNTNFCNGNPPADFNWTMAQVSLPTTAWGSIFPVTVGDLTIDCGGSMVGSVTYSCCGGGAYQHLTIAWSSAGGSLANVTINVTQW